MRSQKLKQKLEFQTVFLKKFLKTGDWWSGSEVDAYLALSSNSSVTKKKKKFLKTFFLSE
jgi:hypothetical protein